MNVLVIGSGGREHALVWKLRQSPQVERLFCAPGNAGIARQATLVPIKAADIGGLAAFAEREKIDLTVVGPEQPLVTGIVDEFRRRGLAIFGPTQYAAQLEGSKVFAKDFLTRYSVPTARFGAFTAEQEAEAVRFAESLVPPVVVKADGLAAGKGVLICGSRGEAIEGIRSMLRGGFGDAGRRVVVEEFLTGEEASIFVLTDGERFATLAPAQDHKRILDGDLGKNTGGMGAYAPAPVVTSALLTRVTREIIRPTLDGMRQDGYPYTGCLYVGLMITESGPKVLEFNCRFGDPEAQVVIPLIDADLAAVLMAVAQGRLDPATVRQHPASAVCVVMASQGYPDDYPTGREILGLDRPAVDDGVVVFHAGTKEEGGRVVTAGGRVLGVTAVGYGHDLEGTIRTAYGAVRQITFDGAYFRSDIGARALHHLTRNGR